MGFAGDKYLFYINFKYIFMYIKDSVGSDGLPKSGRQEFIPASGKSPGEGNVYLFQYSYKVSKS